MHTCAHTQISWTKVISKKQLHTGQSVWFKSKETRSYILKSHTILGIIHERKRLQILQILVHLQTFSCIISFQKEIIHVYLNFKSLAESLKSQMFLTNTVTIAISQKCSFANYSQYTVHTYRLGFNYISNCI